METLKKHDLIHNHYSRNTIFAPHIITTLLNSSRVGKRKKKKRKKEKSGKMVVKSQMFQKNGLKYFLKEHSIVYSSTWSS